MGVIIYSALPNPAGSDTEGEVCELLNTSQNSVHLDGWTLSDASGKTFSFQDLSIGPGETLSLPRSKTRLALNNDSETLTLFNALHEVVDEVSYDQKARDDVWFVREGRFLLPQERATIEETQEIIPIVSQATFQESAQISGQIPHLWIVAMAVGLICAGIFWYSYAKVYEI